ncbi:MAG: hypothetical protein AAGG02_01460 [Cyanobacteria bacterium P01_H01_bin.15]
MADSSLVGYDSPLLSWFSLGDGFSGLTTVVGVGLSGICRASTGAYCLPGCCLGVDVLSVVLLKQRLVKDPKIWRFIWVALLSQAVSLPLLIQSVFSDKVLWRGQWRSVAETE